MGYLQLPATRAQLGAHELDALLILSPRHFYYATGHNSWFMNLYGEAGFGAAIVPADPAVAPAALVSDVEEVPFRKTAPEFATVAAYPVWIAFVDGQPPATDAPIFSQLVDQSVGQPAVRAGQIDPAAVIAHLAELLRALDLAEATIGTEASFLSAQVSAQLAEQLPAVRWRDATALLERLRAVKAPAEADLLRRGTQLAEAGIQTVLEMLQPEVEAGAIAHRYRLGVFEAAAGQGDVGSARITLRVGPDVLDPVAAGSYRLCRGDVVFLDCGVEVAGYWADMGRCVVLGRASAAQRAIYGALRAGFDAAVEQLRIEQLPGTLFQIGIAAVHAAGMTSYVRGNVGHGIGLARAPERPILAREESLALTPGNVISVEFPYYIGGIGAFQIEDTFYLTETGVECFNRLSRELVELA